MYGACDLAKDLLIILIISPALRGDLIFSADLGWQGRSLHIPLPHVPWQRGLCALVINRASVKSHPAGG